MDESVSVIGLHGLSVEHPGRVLFERFHDTATAVLEEGGASPTFVAAEGGTHSGTFVRSDGRAHQRLRKSKFEGISVLSLAANDGSDDPAFRHFAI
jgi:hypothetical protein